MTTQQAATPGPAAPDERLARLGVASRLLQRPELGSLMGALAVLVFFAVVADSFWSLDGASNWLDVSADIGIVAVPVALLMIGGEFDLSAGVMVGASGTFFGLLVTEASFNVWVAGLCTLGFGILVGWLNGFVTVTTQLPSFIVTLGTFFILRGLVLGITLKITGTVRVADLDTGSGYDSMSKLFASTFWSPHDYPVSILWWIGITAVGTWSLTRTRVGNWIYSVGGDPVAARNVGVPVSRTKITLFVMTSLTAAFLGVMTALRLASVQADQGVGNEFLYIIAAVVGGCLLTGGYGSAIGASIGALILGMATIGIPFAGWDSDWTYFFQGLILVLAVLLNTVIQRRARKARR